MSRIEIPMPKMGESIMEGTIIKWHKKVGDPIKKDETLFEISTDKVDSEIPSPVDGVLSEILYPEGETVNVGKVVAYVESNSSVEVEKEETLNEVINSEEEKNTTVDEVKENLNNKLIEENNQENVIEIPMPKMGESITEGTLIKWYKQVGDTVKKDETIFEISTDKVDTEVPSPADGILKEILVKEQETVSVGTIVAKLTSSSETKSYHPLAENVFPLKEREKPTEEFELQYDKSMHPQISSQKISNREEVDNKQLKEKSSRFYSPLVLNIARTEKISFEELEKIDGTGINGRVTKNDILNYINNKEKVKANFRSKETESILQPEKEGKIPTPVSSKFEPAFVTGQIEQIPMDNIRQKIMQHMINSRDTSVHVSAMLEVDMTKIHNYIQKNKERFQKSDGIKLTYMPFIANATVKALKEFPYVNASIDGTTIILKKYVNLGIAVALEPNGLIVPNIKSANEKNIIGLAKSIAELAEKARTKKLTPDDISGGTFTITNYGVFGTIFGTPIINQPEVAILGVGAVVKKTVVIEVDGNDTIAIKPMMYLTLTHDHRLIDGMLGGKFLMFIKNELEKFNENLFT
ncbi:MAG: 2-oxoglutarate dehydrogenase, E2 component, dihydrolipoamide succinyltransferase [Ignavibacterium sp.]